jgi:hypothetical protein
MHRIQALEPLNAVRGKLPRTTGRRQPAACAPQTATACSLDVFNMNSDEANETKQPQRSFPFLRTNERESKPRKRGLTEIRGPYYSVVGRRYLEDLFEMMGAYVVQLECLRAGIWGTKSLWGRVVTYKEPRE